MVNGTQKLVTIRQSLKKINLVVLELSALFVNE